MRYYVVCTFALIAMLHASLAASSITAYDNQTAYVTSNHVFYNNEVAQGFVRLNAGFTVMPPHACANLDLLLSVSGGIDLRETSTIRLLKDLEFDSGVTLTTGGTIDGRGHTLILNGDFRIPDGKVLHFSGDTIIDAQGHDIVIGENAQIFIDTNVTLTIANAMIKNMHNAPTLPALQLAALTSKLALDNVVFAPVGDFLFQQGQLFVHNDVMITGTSAFVYNSPTPSFITQHGQLSFDHNTTFSYSPLNRENNLIQMADASSVLSFDNCDIAIIKSELELIKGTVLFDGKVILNRYQSPISLPISNVGTFFNIYNSSNPYSVSASPNGQFIAVTSQYGGVSNEGTIQIFHFTDPGDPTLISQYDCSTDTGITPFYVSWSPDGQFIGVTNYGGGSNSVGTLQIFAVDAFGYLTTVGAPYNCSYATGAVPFSLAWSFSGQFIAVTNEQGGANNQGSVQILSFTGSGTPTPIGQYNCSLSTGIRAYSGAWSPDDQFLAIASNAYGRPGSERVGTVQILSFSGSGDPTYVGQYDCEMSKGYYPYSLSWSSAGNFIAVANVTGGSNNLGSVQILSFSGSGDPTSIGQYNCSDSTGGNPLSARWSPDAQFIVVAHTSGGSNNLGSVQILSFSGAGDPTSTGLYNCSSNTGSNPHSATWFPTGNFIALANSAGGGYLSGSIQVFSFSGSGNPTLTGHYNSLGMMGNAPNSVAWSPDGQFIAVADYSGGSNGVGTIQILNFNESGDPTAIGKYDCSDSTGSNPYSVAWSPDGQFVAVANYYGGGNEEGTIQILSFSGSGDPTAIGKYDCSDSMGSFPYSVAWSPDGQFVAVTNYYGGGNEIGTIQILSFTGSGDPTAIGKYDCSDATGSNPYSVAWSPDGQFIAVTNNYGGSNAVGTIKILSFNGSGDPIAMGKYDCSDSIGSYPHQVAWSPDGQFVAVANYSGGLYSLGSAQVLQILLNKVNGIAFGNGNGNDDVNVIIKSGASINVFSDRLSYNNVG